jgi:hypothetical protein
MVQTYILYGPTIYGPNIDTLRCDCVLAELVVPFSHCYSVVIDSTTHVCVNACYGNIFCWACLVPNVCVPVFFAEHASLCSQLGVATDAVTHATYGVVKDALTHATYGVATDPLCHDVLNIFGETS